MTDAEYEKLHAEMLALARHVRGNRKEITRKLRDLLERTAGCRDCGSKYHETLPMLKPDVWFKAVPSGHGQLCRACLEKRLGRPFAREDCIDPEYFDEEDFHEDEHLSAALTATAKRRADRIAKRKADRIARRLARKKGKGKRSA